MSSTSSTNDKKTSPIESFKKKHPFDKRKTEAGRMRAKYPDRIPVIVEKNSRSDVKQIDRIKYLIPSDFVVGQLIAQIRSRIKLTPENALFLFFDEKYLPPCAALMSEMYKAHKDPDGFLYVIYSSESTFGSQS